MYDNKISFQESIKCNPKIVEAYINLGGINYKLNELDEAEENYNKAIDLEPDYFKTYFNLDTFEPSSSIKIGNLLSLVYFFIS